MAAIIILPLALSIVNGKSPASRAVTSPSAAAMLPADTPLDQAMSVSGRVGARPVVKLTAPLSAPSSLIKDTLITGEAVFSSQGMPRFCPSRPSPARTGRTRPPPARTRRAASTPAVAW
ncbi:hypothetical protein ADENT20671_0009 [Actinomyces denticolens]|uniref:hypothetical protein n=1 Tax=Actinomyces denticolens TaxID=52767 RepID=UPI0009D619B1|nr:hypothetical protein [Actinomyces denticolens]GAV93269.1 hypothetical protein ADENT20671_0009 [Actinomyces denticolens]